MSRLQEVLTGGERMGRERGKNKRAGCLKENTMPEREGDREKTWVSERRREGEEERGRRGEGERGRGGEGERGGGGGGGGGCWQRVHQEF